ncbi:MAG: hypothetical protein DMG38_29220 [Acidobacteria bacterium]|nr:MAG: hypothetical protein DMG38_29220 [Acidobacteriota bacterium]
MTKPPANVLNLPLEQRAEMRKRLASLSFSEKIKILEKLRDRSLAIAASGLRRKKEIMPASGNR